MRGGAGCSACRRPFGCKCPTLLLRLRLSLRLKISCGPQFSCFIPRRRAAAALPSGHQLPCNRIEPCGACAQDLHQHSRLVHLTISGLGSELIYEQGQAVDKAGSKHEGDTRTGARIACPHLPFLPPPPPPLPPLLPLPPAAAAGPAFLPPLLPPSSRPFLLMPFCFMRYRSSRAAAWGRASEAAGSAAGQWLESARLNIAKLQTHILQCGPQS